MSVAILIVVGDSAAGFVAFSLCLIGHGHGGVIETEREASTWDYFSQLIIHFVVIQSNASVHLIANRLPMLIITYTVRNVLYRISFSLITASKWLFMHLNGIAMLEFIKISKHILRY